MTAGRLLRYLLCLALAAPALARAGVEDLKLLISVEQPSVIFPFPARVTMQIHNSGMDTLWLYRRASPWQPEAENPLSGSTLEVRLAPAESESTRPIANPARAAVLESVGLPRPKMVMLRAGDDYEEKVQIRLTPGETSPDGHAIWGGHRLSVIYRARYSNAEEVERIVGVTLWQGEVTSNTVELKLLPPPEDAQGSVAGTVASAEGRLLRDAVVSLTDEQERLVDQFLTSSDGRYSFEHLPWGLYWVTARIRHSPTDSAIFRHILVGPQRPAEAVKFVMYAQEIYEPKKVFHKPVLFRVTDAEGTPLAGVTLDVLWSNGPVVDKTKGQSSDDGTLALELVPGRNFVTLRRHGCPKVERWVDVAGGGGIDGFKLALECAVGSHSKFVL